MRTYRGIREPLCHVRVIDDAAAAGPAPTSTSHAIGVWRRAEHELAVPRELIPQARVAFDWGGDGPGTHYLAVALLAELFGVAHRALIKASLPFMRRFLTHLPKDDFEISESILRALLQAVGVPPVAPASPPALPGKTPSSDGDGAQSKNGGAHPVRRLE